MTKKQEFKYIVRYVSEARYHPVYSGCSHCTAGAIEHRCDIIGRVSRNGYCVGFSRRPLANNDPCACGSMAINIPDEKAKTEGRRCDVCHWRDRATAAEAIAERARELLTAESAYFDSVVDDSRDSSFDEWRTLVETREDVERALAELDKTKGA